MSLSILMKKQILQLSLSKTSIQSHHIEVVQGDIFMVQKIRFGLVLGRLAILKKRRADYDQLLRVFFSCFQGQKKLYIFLKKYWSVLTKKLHKMKVRKTKKDL